MAVQYLKRGKTVDEKAQADAHIHETVKHMLADIARRKDAAVRELSEKLDHWSPYDFRLSEAQIQETVNRLPQQVIDDIQFAQEQVRKFAKAQRAALQDIEVETLPGVIRWMH